MLYGRPTKHVRIVNENTLTIEPQRFQVLTLWRYYSGATARTDGLDLQDTVNVPEGSKITKHKLEILVTPETIEPQQLYIGRIKLSFHDVYSHAICGGRFEQGSYLDTATENFAAKTTPITPAFYPDIDPAGKTFVQATGTSDTEIGGLGSGEGIQEWMLDDHIKHFINFKKVTVFDQRPLMGERWQRIPSKVKRVNEGTFYGMIFFNDSTRGATPADTQITINVKSYIEEMAI